jgi:CubicO group peptidase (beta-lactamase class C family)
VRRCVPELRLKDERATAAVTVLHLLNHTSGLDRDLLVETGEGDDALAVDQPRLVRHELRPLDQAEAVRLIEATAGTAS